MFSEFLSSLKELTPLFEKVFNILKTWWWLIIPSFFGKQLLFYWLWWRKEKFDATVKRVLIEVRIPRESLKPIRAMETVMTGLWQLYGPPNWYEKWWKGEFILSYSFEIVAIDGVPHFYIRLPERYRTIAESHIYSQYPEAEISLVDDYTQNVPQDIPDKDWEMWGTDYKLTRPESYPIKTYPQFETERETEEEKRIDPIAGLLEGMARLKSGEQIWVQIVATPTLDELPWVKDGEKLRDKLVRRKEAPAPKPMIQELFDLVVMGQPPGAQKKEEDGEIPPEMKLTPGEKEVVAAVEKKIGKLGFITNVRYIYLARRDAFSSSNIRIAMSYFVNFVTENFNGIVPWGETITKVKQNWYDWFWFVKRRLYLKKRRIFRNYVLRENPKFPQEGGTFMLNTEELASIYHFPSRMVAPAPLVPRVEAKKGEAPSELPVEE